MLAIYIGHFGQVGGKLYPFVFLYHVPLFFIAAGFFARADESIAATAVRLARRLLAPYVFFALLYTITLVLFNDWPWEKTQAALTAFAVGIRNQTPAGSLWFLPCLFIVAIAHAVVLRFTRNPLAGLAFGAGCLLISQHGLTANPLATPSWALNADSALYYVFWYALGHAAFPLLRRVVHHAWFPAVGIAAVAAAVWLYFCGTAPMFAALQRFPMGRVQALAATGLGVLPVIVVVVANIAIARAIEGVQLLRALGRRTMLLCGMEDFTKLVLPQAMLMIGLKLQLIHPLGVVLFSFVCMWVAGIAAGGVLLLYAPRWSGLRAPVMNLDAGTRSPQVAEAKSQSPLGNL
ncbi:acyltransferase family protein [Ramlibacter monticola]|uniref:Acyltransferase family protein n=2 Tax=Ramlibacter monticola TaxID=1926872 RepID=A0A936Z162_9BURK|nr:acyltransferase family protein [Ramlibacter monticola]